MFNRLRHRFGKSPAPEKLDEAAVREWYDHKARVLEQVLGKQHDIVMHAIFPYAVGGGLDLYYYPNGIPGTGVATMELSEFPDQGSSNAAYNFKNSTLRPPVASVPP